MKTPLIALVAAVVLNPPGCFAEEEEREFARDIVPTFAFEERVQQVVAIDPETEDVSVRHEGVLLASGRLSMRGIDLAALSRQTSFVLEVEDLALHYSLAHARDWKPGQTVAVIPLMADSDEGEPASIEAGQLVLRWDERELRFDLVTRRPAAFSVKAQEAAATGVQDEDYAASGIFSVSFAGRRLEGRSIDLEGSVLSAADPEERVPEELNTVVLRGEIDSFPPEQLILEKPAPGASLPTGPTVLRGVANDANSPVTVLVSVNKQPPQPAQMSGSSWEFTPAEIRPGKNQISIQAIDQDENKAMLEVELTGTSK